MSTLALEPIILLRLRRLKLTIFTLIARASGGADHTLETSPTETQVTGRRLAMKKGADHTLETSPTETSGRQHACRGKACEPIILLRLRRLKHPDGGPHGHHGVEPIILLRLRRLKQKPGRARASGRAV